MFMSSEDYRESLRRYSPRVFVRTKIRIQTDDWFPRHLKFPFKTSSVILQPQSYDITPERTHEHQVAGCVAPHISAGCYTRRGRSVGSSPGQALRSETATQDAFTPYRLFNNEVVSSGPPFAFCSQSLVEVQVEGEFKCAQESSNTSP